MNPNNLLKHIRPHINQLTRVMRKVMRKQSSAHTRSVLPFLCSLFVLLLTTTALPLDISSPSSVQAASPAVSTSDHLWVDAANGQDQNHGLAQSAPLRTIQQATDLAGPGTTIHILPGVYRESIRPVRNGAPGAPILYVAEGGPGTAAVRGSEPSSSLRWTQLTSNNIGLPAGVDPREIYYADLSGWALAEAPRFVVRLNSGGEVVQRLPLAREPDWQVVREWKYSEYWWTADGGSGVPGCDPATDAIENCDQATWSTTQLIDRTNDGEPAGIEAGNLTTRGNLTGATLMVLDTRQAHWMFRRTIASHNVAAGTITVDRPCTYGSSGTALGWGSKYYVEGLPSLLDHPGEWWYDANSKRLYLWPPEKGSPASQTIEISRRDNGFDWTDRSNQTIDGLTIEFYNQHIVYQNNNYKKQSRNNTIRNSNLRYANWGVWVTQSTHADWPTSVTDGFKLLNSEIGYMDSRGMTLSSWWPPDGRANSFSHPGVTHTTILGNHLHHLGFRSDEEHGYGIELRYADTLRFEGNHVHHTAHHGVQILKSVIQSPQEYGFAPSEIKTGEILIADNLFEKACQLTTECAAVKIWGAEWDNHVFRDLLVTGNIFRDTFGWTYVTEKRRLHPTGADSQANGLYGFGLDVDMASGIHLYRNIAYNNGHIGFRFAGTWRDGDIVCYNNVAANSVFGVRFGGITYDTHPSVNTQLVNNIIANNEAYGILAERPRRR